MKDYVILELENGKKCVVIDNLNYSGVDYFLTAEVIDEKMNISDDFDIYVYDGSNNVITRISDNSVEDVIRGIFNERIENNLSEYEMLKDVNCENLIKLKVVAVEGLLYKLENNGETCEKYIHIYGNVIPGVDDEIYLSKNVMDEKVLSYGYISDVKKLNGEEIFILERNGQRVYYTRYYG